MPSTRKLLDNYARELELPPNFTLTVEYLINSHRSQRKLVSQEIQQRSAEINAAVKAQLETKLTSEVLTRQQLERMTVPELADFINPER